MIEARLAAYNLCTVLHRCHALNPLFTICRSSACSTIWGKTSLARILNVGLTWFTKAISLMQLKVWIFLVMYVSVIQPKNIIRNSCYVFPDAHYVTLDWLAVISCRSAWLEIPLCSGGVISSNPNDAGPEKCLMISAFVELLQHFILFYVFIIFHLIFLCHSVPQYII